MQEGTNKQSAGGIFMPIKTNKNQKPNFLKMVKLHPWMLSESVCGVKAREYHFISSHLWSEEPGAPHVYNLLFDSKMTKLWKLHFFLRRNLSSDRWVDHRVLLLVVSAWHWTLTTWWLPWLQLWETTLAITLRCLRCVEKSWEDVKLIVFMFCRPGWWPLRVSIGQY